MEYGGKWQMSLWAESLRAVTCFHPLCISPQPRDVHGPKNGCLLAQNDTLSRAAAQLAADDISHEQHTSLCGLSPHPHPVWRLPTARNGHVGPQCSGRWNVGVSGLPLSFAFSSSLENSCKGWRCSKIWHLWDDKHESEGCLLWTVQQKGTETRAWPWAALPQTSCWVGQTHICLSQHWYVIKYATYTYICTYIHTYYICHATNPILNLCTS